MTDLIGKTAIVTGSTSGIGFGIAAAGANVVLNGFGDAGEIAAHVELDGLGSGSVVYDGADMTKPKQLAGVALFLCSDAAEKITGIALPVDGGWTAA